MDSYLIKDFKKVRYISLKRLEEFPFLTHGFSCRLNGNKDLFYKALNVFEDKVVFLKQIHSHHILIIHKEVDFNPSQSFEGDAIITDQPGLPIAVRTADCLPIILFDQRKKTIAIIHAGRRGTFLGITKRVVEKLREEFDSDPADILAGMGPSIKSCCYEVKKDVTEVLKREFSNWKRYIKETQDKKHSLDLDLMNSDQLRGEGVPEKNIINAGLCTCCHRKGFYSYRRDREAKKRMINVVMLSEDG